MSAEGLVRRSWYRLLEKERVRQFIDPHLSMNGRISDMPSHYNHLVDYVSKLERRVRQLEKFDKGPA